ncbi:MAG: type IV pilin protein [Bdellovibrionia bacterium]
MRKYIRRDNSGFTLVELMVVVALVGVLSAIAIPNYTHFTAKARQAEAKVALSAMYTAERAFSVESGSYTYCLRQAGYVPDTQNRFYMVGATSYSHPTNLCGPSGGNDCRKYRYLNSADCNTPNSDCCNYGPINASWPHVLSYSDIMYDSSVTADRGTHTAWSMLIGPSYGGTGIETNVTQNTFLLTAIGCIFPVNAPNYWTSPLSSALRADPHGPKAFDAWTIDENRTLSNPYPGF